MDKERYLLLDTGIEKDETFRSIDNMEDSDFICAYDTPEEAVEFIKELYNERINGTFGETDERRDFETYFKEQYKLLRFIELEPVFEQVNVTVHKVDFKDKKEE